jgi:N-acetyl sugar amidotransferase
LNENEKTIVVGIDASRNRSGGARAHLIGILSGTDPIASGIRRVHVWSYRGLLDSLPDMPWLVKHGHPALEGPLYSQIWWQYRFLAKEVRDAGCQVLLNTDAGSVCSFRPAVVISQDMLPFEPQEMRRYGFTKARLRLMALRVLHERSMRRAAGTIFLTKYASTVIQNTIGKVAWSSVIPHGVGTTFKRDPVFRDLQGNTPIRCVYVSHVTMYKHQWVVVRAIADLRRRGRNVSLLLAGEGFGRAKELLTREMAKVDPRGEFVQWVGPVAHENVPALLDAADIVIFASSCENLPITLIEGMASGRPVACSDRGPMPEVLQGAGSYFNPESEESIANAIETLVADSELRARMATSSRELSNRFSWADSAKQTWDFLHSALRKYEATRSYRICSTCIMDTTDPGITFDGNGVCDHCRNYHLNILPNWHPDDRGRKVLQKQIDQIKEDGAGKDHDCLIGVSGGVDSSYLTYLAKEEFGLRPLIFHVDAGWNSQIAVNNIERLVDKLGLDLYTEVINWEEMRDLQLAFFKAQVPHLDTPQDHAFFAALYNFAARNGFKYVLTGANYSTECVHNPLEWHYHASDLVHLKDIHEKFGSVPLNTFPLADILKYRLYYRYFKGIHVVKPLNYVPYVKASAMQLLIDRFGWQAYPQKHFESRFTKFYEAYWLPTKFGYDKRRVQYSSLILTNQMSREDALRDISLSPYDKEQLPADFDYIATKLGISSAELQELMDGPNRTYRDYKSRMPIYILGTKILRLLGIEKRVVR